MGTGDIYYKDGTWTKLMLIENNILLRVMLLKAAIKTRKPYRNNSSSYTS